MDNERKEYIKLICAALMTPFQLVDEKGKKINVIEYTDKLMFQINQKYPKDNEQKTFPKT